MFIFLEWETSRAKVVARLDQAAEQSVDRQIQWGRGQPGARDGDLDRTFNARFKLKGCHHSGAIQKRGTHPESIGRDHTLTQEGALGDCSGPVQWIVHKHKSFLTPELRRFELEAEGPDAASCGLTATARVPGWPRQRSRLKVIACGIGSQAGDES